jgi:Tfp pilus assembly protein PilP
MMAKALAIIAILAPLLLGCEDAPPPILGPAVRDKAPSPTRTITSPVGPVADEPQLALNDSDFKEDKASRDPFRRLLGKPEGPATPPDCEKGKLVQYGLDELKLTGIVGGGARPVAMFRGPTTDAVTTVKRGDRIGKTCGQIKAILRDKVIVTIKVTGSEKRAERVIPLHTS